MHFLHFVRYFEAEEKMRHLLLDIKSKGEEIQRLQKQVSQKEGDNEKLQESISNISKEKQQLMERYILEYFHLNYLFTLVLECIETKRMYTL